MILLFVRLFVYSAFVQLNAELLDAGNFGQLSTTLMRAADALDFRKSEASGARLVAVAAQKALLLQLLRALQTHRHTQQRCVFFARKVYYNNMYTLRIALRDSHAPIIINRLL